MKKLFIILFLICGGFMYAQIAPNKYYVQFVDKHNSPYAISNPSDYLSQEAISRRLALGIPIDSTDLPVNPAYINAVLSINNVSFLNKTKWLNGITIQTADPNALLAINNLPFVQGVTKISQQTSAYPHQKMSTILNATSYKSTPIKQQKGISTYNYGLAYNQVNMINADYLHDLGFDGQGISIAVIDAGFYRVDSLVAFDSLRTNNQIRGVKDFVNNQGNVYNEHTHGMMVLSLMGANVPSQLVGTAPKASYWLLRSEDAPTEYIIEEYNWVSAAEFADSVGVHVINSSLGYSDFDDPSQNHVFADLDGQTTVVTKGANFASDKGIIVVNSAGNSAQAPWQRIIAPADAFNILSVASVNASEMYSSFSSVGPSADGRVKPDVAAQGEGAYVADTQNGIMSGNGTSFSSPIIAGAVACLIQAHPNATVLQILDAVKQSAHQYNTPDSLLGYGIPNFQIAHQLLNTVNTSLNYLKQSIEVFPNPFSEKIHIRLNLFDAQDIIVELLSIEGRLCHIESFSSISIQTNISLNVNHLPKGIYILKISSENNVFNRKIVKTY